jgi:hypothetical protein
MKHLGMMMFAVVVSLMFAGNAFAIDWYNNDVPTDPCGAINPDRACYAVSGSGCTKGQGYDACNRYCVCVYNENLKKCGTRLSCKDIAAEEKNACLANCVADW